MRLLLVAVIITIVAALHWRFPYVLRGENALQHALYLTLLLSIVALTSRRITRDRLPRVVRDASIWLAVLAVMVLGYSFRDVFSHRMLAELMPSQVRELKDGSIAVRASEGGHFFIEATVNDAKVLFMVDTGATDIVLAPADAKLAGLNPESLSYDNEYSSANGYGRAATVTLDSLQVGPVTLRQQRASVNRADMEYSLLGMRFLRQLKSFRVEGNTLVLIP